MPVNETENAKPIETGVDGRFFTPTAQWLQAVEAVRARERRLAAAGVEILRRRGPVQPQ